MARRCIGWLLALLALAALVVFALTDTKERRGRESLELARPDGGDASGPATESL
ncbi:MAG: hypothetical protein ABIG03_06605 [Candidatus Eisenbacteria bacterium]